MTASSRQALFADLALAGPVPVRQAYAMQSALRMLRKRKKLSLEALAEQVDLSAPFLSRVERGKRELGNESRRKVARALGVREADLQVSEGPGADHPPVNSPLTNVDKSLPTRDRVGEEQMVIEAKLPIINKIWASVPISKLGLLEAYVDMLIADVDRAGPGPQQRGRTS